MDTSEYIIQEQKNIITGTVRTAEEILKILDNCKMAKPNKILTPTDLGNPKPFIFTGQYTDLIYFQNAKSMPISAINALATENPDLYMAVKDNFEKAAREGHIFIDKEKGVLTITPKGEEYINRDNFKTTALSDQTKEFSKTLEELRATVENSTVFGVELTGQNDLAYFYRADTLNLSDFQDSPNIRISTEVFKEVEEWKKSGLVIQDKKNPDLIKITPKGKSELAKSKLNILAEKNVADLGNANSVVAVTKVIVNNAAKVIEAAATSQKR